MAWTTPLTAVSSTPLTAAQWNASVRDNFLESAAAKATAAGRIFATTGANSIAERVPTIDAVGTSDTTTSTSFTSSLASTSGPVVGPLTTGVSALISIACILTNSGANTTYASYAVSGATTTISDDRNGVGTQPATGGSILSASKVRLRTLLTAGSNTFTAQYRVGAGTGTFINRELSVIPF